ncbi:MAG TPA: InlB B-repeat-containing protein [Spirochaetota bacterium]|nr:InlB B-repeat-containing protein [Spirochaetota bacterium]
MKRKRLFILKVILIMILPVWISCDRTVYSDLYEQRYFLVTFYSEGEIFDAQYVLFDTCATKPTDPTTTSLDTPNFEAWYTDGELFTDEWDFENRVVEADVNLYARWLP